MQCALVAPSSAAGKARAGARPRDPDEAAGWCGKALPRVQRFERRAVAAAHAGGEFGRLLVALDQRALDFLVIGQAAAAQHDARPRSPASSLIPLPARAPCARWPRSRAPRARARRGRRPSASPSAPPAPGCRASARSRRGATSSRSSTKPSIRRRYSPATDARRRLLAELAHHLAGRAAAAPCRRRSA